MGVNAGRQAGSAAEQYALSVCLVRGTAIEPGSPRGRSIDETRLAICRTTSVC
ncbi:hypothetical protein BAUCODRAFT_286451 [Baudoinia panamericana UAMH 10762]|uniref:Uncharacterized protein n=1 Tax=Baudoinia panamericana (strain UAMH 10762) TaxID=717646 RepID=M2N097_BAUPA|nr:uncharacterized protein BAUCODRAFT_286451 [Baudoinia panamericana UAMH 10762]EMC92359.1 hypothetical protein BAUCODRAFT_286451 [Baudoinia panamericana UAMH 10762]